MGPIAAEPWIQLPDGSIPHVPTRYTKPSEYSRFVHHLTGEGLLTGLLLCIMTSHIGSVHHTIDGANVLPGVLLRLGNYNEYLDAYILVVEL